MFFFVCVCVCVGVCGGVCVRVCHPPDADDQPPKTRESTRTMLENVFLQAETHQKNLAAASTKASGPDHIPVRVLKEYSAELAGSLCQLFKSCFTSGSFPNLWKTASVKPIHKKDSGADPSKYRPISLLSVISKIMEAAVHNQLQNYFSGTTSFQITAQQTWKVSGKSRATTVAVHCRS